MLQKDYTVMSVQTLINRINKRQIAFNNVVQRGNVWKKDIKRRSLFIHSLLENYPVPPLYANKVGLVYDMLDGKQRSTTLVNFFNNEFRLSADTPVVQLESGERFNVAGLYYNDLPEELQDRIRDFPLAIHYVENASNEEEIKEIFLRLNLGKAMTLMEMSRVKAICLNLIHELAGHELLQTALSADAKNRYTHEEYIIKTWMVLYTANPSFVSKDTRALMENVTITPEQAIEISSTYDRLFDSYKYLHASGKDAKKISISMLKGIRLIGLAFMAKRSIDDGISIDAYANWIQSFFSAANGKSVDDAYNETLGVGCNESANIKKRLKAMLRHYKKTLVV